MKNSQHIKLEPTCPWNLERSADHGNRPVIVDANGKVIAVGTDDSLNTCASMAVMTISYEMFKLLSKLQGKTAFTFQDSDGIKHSLNNWIAHFKDVASFLINEVYQEKNEQSEN